MKPERFELAHGIDLVADVLIPPTGPWPAPSALQLGADLVAHLRESEAEKVRDALALLDAPDAFAQASVDGRIGRLTRLQDTEPVAFEVVRRCVYFAYYAQPAVIRLLRELGYDINESPQPQGYRMEPFTRTAVARVDAHRLIWIPADRVGTRLKTAS
jgi:hypothetical protein